MKDESELWIGTIGIDCGMAWIGDASEVASHPELMVGAQLGQARISVIKGGVAVTAGYGDGQYKVFARRRPDGRITELRVVFIGEDAP